MDQGYVQDAQGGCIIGNASRGVWIGTNALSPPLVVNDGAVITFSDMPASLALGNARAEHCIAGVLSPSVERVVVQANDVSYYDKIVPAGH